MRVGVLLSAYRCHQPAVRMLNRWQTLCKAEAAMHWGSEALTAFISIIRNKTLSNTLSNCVTEKTVKVLVCSITNLDRLHVQRPVAEDISAYVKV